MDQVLERFWNKVEIQPNGCWDWVGAITNRGYGLFNDEIKLKLVHRLSYEINKGKIPAGLQIDHLCRNRKCVNPEHLEVVTQKENMMRGFGLASMYSKRSHCKRGHPLVKENLGKWRNSRDCLICSRLRCKKAYNKAKLNDNKV